MPETAGLRVGVVEGGCSGLTYDVRIAEGPHSGDTILEINNTRVFVDEFSAQYINGMIVDWISSLQESRFVFQNPNETELWVWDKLLRVILPRHSEAVGGKGHPRSKRRPAFQAKFVVSGAGG